MTSLPSRRSWPAVGGCFGDDAGENDDDGGGWQKWQKLMAVMHFPPSVADGGLQGVHIWKKDGKGGETLTKMKTNANENGFAIVKPIVRVLLYF